MRRPSLEGVLVTAIAGVAVGAVVLTAGLTLGLVRLTAERTTLDQLHQDADRAAQIQERLTAGGRRPGMRPNLRQELAPPVRFVPDGEAVPPGLDASEGRATVGGREMLYVARRIETPNRTGTLYVFRPVTEAKAAPGGLFGRVLGAGAVALVVSAVVAYVIAQRISRPLGRLSAAARRMARGERVELPAGAEPEEVADLREAFSEMSAELSSAREREKSFLLSVSHELRTPLTAIRGYGEALADGTARGSGKAGAVILSESRRLERLVGDLIDLARLQSGEFSVVTEEVALGRLCRAVGEALRPKAQEAGVRLEVGGDGTIVTTDPDRSHQMIANLAENALRVTPAGGRVSISARGTTVEVADSGPGLTVDDAAHAFERFYLWRKYRGQRPVGSGLGLAIVGELARRLAVDVNVSSEPGAGTRFTLSFNA